MSGILYGVGVGPGDPELMTLKAVRLIKENDIIAVPGADVRETVAYKIAVQAVPELADKELLPIYMPMTHDKAELELNHEKGAKALEAALNTGKNVVFLTGRSDNLFYIYICTEESRSRRLSDKTGKRYHFLLRNSSTLKYPADRVEPATSCTAGSTPP